MRKKNILLGWEMGAGIGYSVHLRDLAKSLQHHGHSPTVALRSIETANRLFSDCEFPVLQAPYVIGRLTPSAQRDGFFPASFADLMACNGFGSEDHLYSMVRGWRDLIDVVKPDLIVGGYCPLLTMAAFGRIPVMLFGPGFTTPPAHLCTFPSFHPDQTPYSDQSQTLEIVQRVQQRFGAMQPACLTDIYRGTHRIVTALPELDPYRSCRRDACVGAFERFPPPQPVHTDRFYAYLAERTEISRAVVQALVSSGLSGSLFVRDADVTTWGFTEVDGITIHRTAPDLEQVTRESAVIIHHGGQGTLNAALAAGRPQIIIPQVFDQLLSAEALADSPFVSSIVGDIALDSIIARMNSFLENQEIRATAMEFASSIQNRGLHNAKNKILAASLQLL